MQSDAPIVYFLSGGLDSGAVVGLASQLSSTPLRTLSSASDLPGYDERRYIQDYIARYGTAAELIQPEPGGNLVDELSRIVTHLGGPTAGQGAYTQWWLFQTASRRMGAKVVLSGTGGDEVLAGYHTYLRPYLTSLARDWIADRRWRDLGRLLWGAYRFRRVLGRSYLFNDAVGRFEGKARERMQRFRAWLERGLARPPAAPRWLHPELDPVAARVRPAHVVGIEDQIRTGLLETIMPGWLRIEDRMGMAWSIEARHPFLDVELIEFLGQVDYRLKIRGLSTKNLIRTAMAGIMPERPRRRRDKMGMPTPLAHWLRTSDREAVRDALGDAGRRHPDLFDGAALLELFDAHQERADHSKAIFTALTATLWLDRVAAVTRSASHRHASGASPR